MFQKLTPIEKEIAIVGFGAQIKSYTHDDLLTAMLGLIGRTHLNCSVPLDSAKVDITIDELVSDLKKYNGNLTILEIELAFKNGWKKEYGEYYGLGNATYFQWINAYAYGEKRLKVKKALADAKIKQPEPGKKDEAEVEIIMKDACLKAFDDYCKGAVIRDFGNVKYEFLVKHKILIFSKERKDAIFELAKQQTRQTAIDDRQRTETIEKALSKLSADTIISESKRMALLEFFKDLKESEMELSDMF